MRGQKDHAFGMPDPAKFRLAKMSISNKLYSAILDPRDFTTKRASSNSYRGGAELIGDKLVTLTLSIVSEDADLTDE